ncbi:MAG TPA: hypothetical protein DD733_03625 [Clostridiales bacterium]|nr:hypothetical protein [Clostridiales bacterium]
MKKVIVLFLMLVMMISLSACNGEPKSESSVPKDNTTSDYSNNTETKVYGIGEAAEAKELSITIDKVVTPDADMFIYGPKEGFTYIQVYFTFKNISDVTIQTPKRQAICIVYDEDDPDSYGKMTSDESSADVYPGKKEGLYDAYSELAPGESTSGWMIYPRPMNKTKVTMHYYSGFVNVPPDIIFGFNAD